MCKLPVFSTGISAHGKARHRPGRRNVSEARFARRLEIGDRRLEISACGSAPHQLRFVRCSTNVPHGRFARTRKPRFAGTLKFTEPSGNDPILVPCAFFRGASVSRRRRASVSGERGKPVRVDATALLRARHVSHPKLGQASIAARRFSASPVSVVARQRPAPHRALAGRGKPNNINNFQQLLLERSPTGERIVGPVGPTRKVVVRCGSCFQSNFLNMWKLLHDLHVLHG